MLSAAGTTSFSPTAKCANLTISGEGFGQFNERDNYCKSVFTNGGGGSHQHHRVAP